ncbi:MAG: DNA-3-methyladenine glycosylase I [Propionibacteriaceae bacterium]|nr:DNA-3-methyladenine glycosylase I [Propionibacteriaceae bacterium]
MPYQKLLVAAHSVSGMNKEIGRCFGTGDTLYERYHDEEWGVPLHGEAELLERIVLEGFQVGLSWRTVLHKREAFREVFAGFDPEKVAAFGEEDVQRLLDDKRIIRNRQKIEAAIANARATQALHEEGRTLDALIWSFKPKERRERAVRLEEIEPAPEAEELAKALKASGFKFVGPVTAYAMMQAVGMVDDHLVGCPKAKP